jgi:chromosome partitioning protein
MRKIAFINAKGGVGKTTSALHTAVGLARKAKVLLIDADQQGHIGLWLKMAAGPHTLAELLTDHAALAECIQPTAKKNLSVILSDRRLEKAVRMLAGEDFRETKLLRAFEDYHDVDYVIFDCAPGMSLVNQNILLYARELILPVAAEYLAIKGAEEITFQLETIKKVMGAGFSPNIAAILPTFYDKRTKKSPESVSALSRIFGEGIVKSPIRMSVRLSEASAAHMDIWEYAPDSPGAEDYARFVKEVAAIGS